jgi:hypothetical protein
MLASDIYHTQQLSLHSVRCSGDTQRNAYELELISTLNILEVRVDVSYTRYCMSCTANKYNAPHTANTNALEQ